MSKYIDLNKITLLHGQVLVEQERGDEKTDSGIIFALEKAKHSKRSVGKVVAFDPNIGEQCHLIIKNNIKPFFEDRELKIGDTLTFDPYAGRYETINGFEYIVLKFTEIIGIIDDSIQVEYGKDSGLMNVFNEEKIMQSMS